MSKVIVVTGANKSIGLAIVRQLLLKAPPNPRLKIYLCSRDSSRGQAALESLKGQEKGHEVVLGELDVGDESGESARRLKERLEKEDGKIDVLVSNAGVATSGPDFNREILDWTFAVNYHGTKKVIQTLLPLVEKAPEPRLVTVTSMAGFSGLIKDEKVRERFTKEDLTEEELETAIQEFKDAVSKGTWEKEGWPSSAYGMSKLSLNAYCFLLARKYPKISINTCCPGWVKTDMAPKGTKTPDQGAQTPVKLALDDLGGVTGKWWQDERVKPW
ncbi:hypothetical protein BDY24DRAFT_382547 [Mrakia frigida]|uniref:uncharacterized protein n=1 Tax=Mrakia frigida TaxID=29902 RepID=UPI003FCC1C62